MIKSLRFIIILTSAFYSYAENIEFTIDEFTASEDCYLSKITQIKFNPDNKMVFKGTKQKEKNITGKIISELIQLSQSDVYPECIIDHTPEEIDAYHTFHDEFVTRPFGSDGTRAVCNWEVAPVYQNVLTNVPVNSILAHSLFEADLKLKKMILGKKLMRTTGLSSFPGFVEFAEYDAMEKKKSWVRDYYETKFYLIPDTLIFKKKDNCIEILKVKLKLISSGKYNGTDSVSTIEDSWTERFNLNVDKVIEKHKELNKIQEVFKLFFMLKTLDIKPGQPELINKESTSEIPGKIKTIKYLSKLSTSDPLINEPGRCRFAWILMSGAITFDYRRASIISK